MFILSDLAAAVDDAPAAAAAVEDEVEAKEGEFPERGPITRTGREYENLLTDDKTQRGR